MDGVSGTLQHGSQSDSEYLNADLPDGVYSIYTYPYHIFKDIEILEPARKGKRNKNVYNIVTAFDIETTRDEETEQSFMYVWQFDVYKDGVHYSCVGRYWQEWLSFLHTIENWLPYDPAHFVIYDHNLSYEFQFVSGVYNFQPEDVFALDKRKVLKCLQYGKFEYRCSYIHSNMRLEDFLKKMGVPTQKSTLDYNKKRYPWTHLDLDEMIYNINDVRGLTEAITKEMEIDGDNLITIPLTSTGYIRRECKEAFKKLPFSYRKSLQITMPLYRICRDAFRGGNCHANRLIVNKDIGSGDSDDKASSYPASLCTGRFPIGKWHQAEDADLDRVLALIETDRAVIFRCVMHNVRLKHYDYPIPYIPISKCTGLYKSRNDNGRVLEAETLEISLCDIDLDIILYQYDFDQMDITECWYALYGKLPKEFTDVILKFFIAKTELKGIEGQEVYYDKSKNKLNASYGMAAQDPVKQSIEYAENEFTEKDDDPEELLQKYNRKLFLPYTWAVYTTAISRYELERGIRSVYEKGGLVLYCDTDSVKYRGNGDYFSDLNADLMDRAKKAGAYATDINGDIHYMGVWEHEKAFSEFRTLGAKKYVYRTAHDGVLHCTIAGVGKIAGAKELEDHGGISAMKDGFVFVEAGGLEAIYNDAPEIKSIIREDQEIEITKNMTLRPSTYTLSRTKEYIDLLRDFINIPIDID